VRRTRNLWLSVAFVGALVAASVVGYFAGYRPVLGLDLEGGVSVILSAPPGTPASVMDQALENIRNRVDAFGTAEPLLFVSGNTIEVQIPGLARGTIRPTPKDQYCLVGEGRQAYGCFPTQQEAQKAYEAVSVKAIVTSVCLTGVGQDPPCFSTQDAADQAIGNLKVEPQSEASPTQAPSAASASPTVGPAPVTGNFCITGPDLARPVCTYRTKAAADAALKAVGTTATNEYCLQGTGDETLQSNGANACYQTQQAGQAAFDALKVQHETQQYCVVSSVGKDLGCFLTMDAAKAQLQATGQERLLQIIGTTARLEEREVLATLTPGSAGYDSTPVTCGTQAEKQTEACSFEALKDKSVVFYGQGPTDQATKYQLGPVLVTGDMIKKATAVYGSASQTTVAGWQVDFTLTPSGTKTFGDVTTRLVGKQLAIVLDQVVISAPTVQNPITNGNGVITGRFTEQRAKDLATVLNAGALPVNLTTQQVVTVSPTLGQASLREGLIAGVAGLILLALYLLFYYRLLAVVAWFGMTIWAILALALVSVAGRTVGYTLTLAGVAGLVISLGVTADSYIVFFERLKDEVRHGKTPRAAVQPAFKRAYRTIVAADTVTGLAAIILYITAISSVRGFALTLGVATALDLFVVYFFKRPTVFLIARSETLVSLRGFGLSSGVAADLSPSAVPVAGGPR
jgi:preprotein translocase subunit SecD